MLIAEFGMLNERQTVSLQHSKFSISSLSVSLKCIHVPIVFFQRRREGMGSITPTDEIEIRHVGGTGRRLQRRATGIRDWPWRETRIAIRVVWRIELEVLARQIA